jgi:hypothetical protein
MKTEPQPSDREVLAGLVERVTYQNAENGRCVIRVKAQGHRDLVTVVGHAAGISAGEWITASGDWTSKPGSSRPLPRRQPSDASKAHRRGFPDTLPYPPFPSLDAVNAAREDNMATGSVRSI